MEKAKALRRKIYDLNEYERLRSAFYDDSRNPSRIW